MVAAPLWLQKRYEALPSDLQTKLRELHEQFKFNEDQIECFTINHSQGFTADNVIEFQAQLQKERQKSSGSSTATGVIKRKSVASSGLGALLKGLGSKPTQSTQSSQAAGAATQESEVVTPNAKRPRDVTSSMQDDLPSVSTPEPATKPARLSLKTSMNQEMQKPVKGPVQRVDFELVGNAKLWTGSRNGTYEWMNESIEDRVAARDQRLSEVEEEMGKVMRARHAGREVLIGKIGVASQSEVVLCGRIACEGLEGKLNEQSLLLEGSRASCDGRKVRLVVSGCERVVAFPGQIVGVLGRTGMTGSTFHATDYVTGIPTPLRPPAIAARPLHVITAAGPYCLREGLNFEPLERVFDHAINEKPDVVVLLGPLLDVSNQKVASGEVKLPGDASPCSFEELYTKLIVPTMNRKMQQLRNTSPETQVLVVPSLDEVLCYHPLPQPPLDAALAGALPPQVLQPFETLTKLGVRFLPNPAHVKINGLNISMTSADALHPVLREVIMRPAGKKIEEAQRLLLQQRTLFPVVPREPASVCESRAAALDFPFGDNPHVCIFPSVSGNPSGSVVDGTLFINPGPICRPAALGTFGEVWTSGIGDAPMEKRARVDIHKLT